MDHTYYSQSSRGEIFGGGIRRRRRRKKRRFLKLFIMCYNFFHIIKSNFKERELQHTEQAVLVSS